MQSGGTAAHRRPTSAYVWPAAFAALGFVAFNIWFSWIGFLQSDDLAYARAAEVWMEQGWNIGNNHWSLRYAIVFPTTLFFAIFGVGEHTLNTTAVLYLLALLGLAHYCVRLEGKPLLAIATAALLATVPMLSRSASFLTADVPEAVFLFASLIVFHLAWNGRRIWMFVLSGALLGLAAVTRETAVCLGAFYVILFLFGYKGDRTVYFWMALGFALIFGPDMLAHWIATGDPLYRVHVSHQIGVSDTNWGLVIANAATSGFDTEGVLAAPRWIKPIIMMLTNQQIGPVMWLGIPAMFAVVRLARRRPGLELVRLVAYFALLWFVITAYLLYQQLYLTPRYQVVSVTAAIICIGAYLSHIGGVKRVLTSVMVFGVMVAGILLIAVSDRHPMFPERQLVSIVRSQPGNVRIWTDPATRYGADWLLERNGDRGRVVAAPPPPGSLYVFSSKSHRAMPADWKIKDIPAGWTVLEQFQEPERSLVTVLRSIGLLSILPSAIVQKLEPEPRIVVLLRVPGA